jgi:hypothetical protein
VLPAPAGTIPVAGTTGHPVVAATQAAVPATPAAVPKPPPPVVPPGTPTEIAGDRADAIAHDIVLHPPQKQVPQQDASHLQIARLKLGGLLDRSVHGSENSEVGRVIDVMVGEDGRPAALELDVGGFMGVGNRKIAVAWTLFDVSKSATEPLRVALTEAQVKSAPAAEESGTVTIVAGTVAAAAPAPTAPLPAAVPGSVPPPAQGAPALPGQPAPPAGPPAVAVPPPPSPDAKAPDGAGAGQAAVRPAPVPGPGSVTPAPTQPWRAGTRPPPGDQPKPRANGRF